MSHRLHLLAAATLALTISMPAHAQVAVGEVYASDASVRGTIMLAAGGTRVFSGSQVAAGATAAVLKLNRGGEVRICPGTSLTVSSSASGTELLLSVNTGALELHYVLSSTVDTLMTPDFQLQLVGPGDFHIGFGADQRGATCVRGLQQNSASVIVSEMLGDGRYQVQPHEEVVFHDGKVSTSQRGALVHCGCPEAPAVMQAEARPPEPASTPEPAPRQPVTSAAEENETHVEVDAPFVFRGENSEPDIPYRVLRLGTRTANDLALKFEPTVVPPREIVQKRPEMPAKVAAQQKEPRKSGGFFKKIGGFFAKMFRG